MWLVGGGAVLIWIIDLGGTVLFVPSLSQARKHKISGTSMVLKFSSQVHAPTRFIIQYSITDVGKLIEKLTHSTSDAPVMANKLAQQTTIDRLPKLS